MNLRQAMSELEALGNEQRRRIMCNHGAPEENFGVKIGDMKKLVRKIKVDQRLALELFDTGNSDAQYMAGLIADPSEFTPELLEDWAQKSLRPGISENIVAGIAAESGYGFEKGLEWIESGQDRIAATRWKSLIHTVSISADEQLDIDRLEKLLEEIPGRIHQSPNRTRDTMNSFVIAVGCFVAPLTDKALAAGKKTGPVEVDHGNTVCKTQSAADYINRVVGMGRVGKKRKRAIC